MIWIFLLAATFTPFISQGSEAEPSSESSSTEVGFASPADQPEGWHALPPGRPFPSLPPDPRDLKTSLHKNSKHEIEANVGAYRSVAGWKGVVSQIPLLFHTGIEGNGYFVMHQEGSKFPLHSSDGLIGVYGEASQDSWFYQMRYTHISAHISDGLFGIRNRIVYTRETLSLRLAHQWGFTRYYGGYHFLAHTVPTFPRHGAQFGFYSVLPWNWQRMHPFFGADWKIKNSEEGSTFNLVGGIALVSALGAPPFRFSVEYLKGNDPRGQFYNEKMEKWSFGIDLDLL